jgi:hypothetical protein
MPAINVGERHGPIQRRNGRWARRWTTVVADSFKRIDDNSLNQADSGHDWNSYPNANTWATRGGWARLRAASAGSKERAYVQSGLADATIQVRMKAGGIGAWGAGLMFRQDTANVCRTVSWRGGTSWSWAEWSGGSLFSSTSFTGPSLAAGTTYTLKLVLSGNAATLYVDGAQVSTNSSTRNVGEGRHGLFADGGTGCLFRNFRVLRP